MEFPTNLLSTKYRQKAVFWHPPPGGGFDPQNGGHRGESFSPPASPRSVHTPAVASPVGYPVPGAPPLHGALGLEAPGKQSATLGYSYPTAVTLFSFIFATFALKLV